MVKDKKSILSLRASASSGISFGSPVIVEAHSPPSEQIIRSSNLDASGFGSKNKLRFVPKAKTVESSKSKILEENSGIYKNPLLGRLLAAIPPLNINLNEYTPPDVTVPIIEEGMIESLIQLNKIHEKAPKLMDINSVYNLDDLNDDFFKDLCFYNSFHALATFNNISEIYKSNHRIIYRLKSRFDQQWYCIKTGINYSETEHITNISLSNHSLLKEIRILSTMNHGNIVKYHASWLEQQSFFLQMEYLIGESLYYFMYSTNNNKENTHLNHLSRFKMQEKFPLTNKASEVAAKQIIKQINNALIYLHEKKNIIHNDVQPTNVLITCSRFHIDYDNFNLSSLRSLIYQGLLGETCYEIIFKLIDFAKSFHVNDKPINHNSLYLPKFNELETTNSLIKRDIHGLALTTIHALCGPEDFCPEMIHKSRILKELQIKDMELKNVLTEMIDSEVNTDSRDLSNKISKW